MTFLFPDLIDDTDTRQPRKAEMPIEPPQPDPLAEALIEHKFVPNEFILDLNKGLTIPAGLERPYPWNLPSRLFIFPIEVTDQAKDGSRKIGLLHPLLAEHPFVRQVEQTLSLAIDPNGAPNEYGYSKIRAGSWWHAVDLISHGLWRELLDTARFTTPEDIAGAVSYGLDYSPYEGKKRNGHISTVDARKVMATLDAPEPNDPLAIIEEHFHRPSGMKSEKGTERWPINSVSNDPYAKAWGHILAIEAGWFAHDRAGFLGWTPAGRERFPPLARVDREIEPYVPPAPVKAVSLADEIAPRPASKGPEQFDLF